MNREWSFAVDDIFNVLTMIEKLVSVVKRVFDNAHLCFPSPRVERSRSASSATPLAEPIGIEEAMGFDRFLKAWARAGAWRWSDE